MTRTGYSCAYMRRRNKHGCTQSVEHYCSATGKYIYPHSCHRHCDKFRTLASSHRRPARAKLEVELL